MKEYYPLIRGLKPYSRAQDVSLLNEWEPAPQLGLPETDTCICGKRHIVHNYIIQNKLTKNAVVVGSECIKRFSNVAMNIYLDAVRYAEGKIVNIPKTIIGRAHKEWRVINEWERDFMFNINRKRILSLKQMNTEDKIVAKIHRAMINRGLSVPS